MFGAILGGAAAAGAIGDWLTGDAQADLNAKAFGQESANWAAAIKMLQDYWQTDPNAIMQQKASLDLLDPHNQGAMVTAQREALTRARQRSQDKISGLAHQTGMNMSPERIKAAIADWGGYDQKLADVYANAQRMGLAANQAYMGQRLGSLQHLAGMVAGQPVQRQHATPHWLSAVGDIGMGIGQGMAYDKYFQRPPGGSYVGDANTNPDVVYV